MAGSWAVRGGEVPVYAALELFRGALLPARVWRAGGFNGNRIPAPSASAFQQL